MMKRIFGYIMFLGGIAFILGMLFWNFWPDVLIVFGIIGASTLLTTMIVKGLEWMNE